jgi:hypothetical protein
MICLSKNKPVLDCFLEPNFVIANYIMYQEVVVDNYLEYKTVTWILTIVFVVLCT